LFGTENPFVRSELLRGKVRKTPGTGQSLSFGNQKKNGDQGDFGLARLPQGDYKKQNCEAGNETGGTK